MSGNPPPQVQPIRTVGSPPAGPATMTVVVGFFSLVASLVVLGSIADGVREQEVFVLDNWATPFLHGIGSPQLDALMWSLTTMGSSLVIVPLFVAAIAALLWTGRRGAALFLTVASGGALFLNATMKLLFERPRPHLPWATVLPDYSFPSGHTMNAFVFYVALALIGWSVFGRRFGSVATVTALVLAFGVGVSRIYLGFHYLTDVIGGLLAGTAWLLIVGAAFRARPSWWQFLTSANLRRTSGGGGAPTRP
jgi:undecaprenyl-diphosphatase